MSSLRDRLRAKFARVERGEKDMHVYQGDAVNFLLDHPFSALFIDTGLGKTIIVLTLLLRLILRDGFKKALVVAPVRVAAQTWPNEIGLWEHVAPFNYSVIRAEDDDPEVVSAGNEAAKIERQKSRAKADDLAELGMDPQQISSYVEKRAASAANRARTAKKNELRLARMNDPASVHVINREALEWLVDQFSVFKEKKVKGRIKKIRKVVNWPYDVVILDESSSFKDHKTIRFKALASVRQQGFIKRLHELTATPTSESYLGLFAQMYLLDLGERLGKYVTRYRSTYFDYNDYSRTYKLKPGAEDAITKKIADICLVMKSGDYLDEEDPMFLPRAINLTDAELTMYKRFERDFILTLPDGEEIEAITAGALGQKLLQLASGAVYNEKGETRVVHNHKIEDLAELHEELQGSPLLVAYWHKSSLERLKKAFPQAKVMDKAGKLIEPWNKGKIDMLLVHPASVGHGLNMQYGPGHDLYMFDYPMSFELFYQLYRRLHRQGQKKRVRIHMPMVRHTDDELAVRRLKNKENVQEAFFRKIIERRRRLAAQREAA